jgi:hypothetical protein
MQTTSIKTTIFNLYISSRNWQHHTCNFLDIRKNSGALIFNLPLSCTTLDSTCANDRSVRANILAYEILVNPNPKDHLSKNHFHNENHMRLLFTLIGIFSLSASQTYAVKDLDLARCIDFKRRCLSYLWPYSCADLWKINCAWLFFR